MGLKEFIGECGRVLKVTKKPSMKDYKTIVKISSLGIAIIGLLGFSIHIISQLIQKII